MVNISLYFGTSSVYIYKIITRQSYQITKQDFDEGIDNCYKKNQCAMTPQIINKFKQKYNYDNLT